MNADPPDSARFFAQMSHELRTPINGLVGYLDLLRCTPLAPEQKELLTGARTAARHVLELLHEVLDHARITEGHLELDRSPFALDAVVNDALTLVSVDATERNVQLTLEIDREPIWVLGDALRLRQILVNLLGNAVKFTYRGTVTVRVRALEGDRVEIDVQDEGRGVPSAHRELVFEPYAQVPGTARRYGGTGLGLPISRRLARAMGGDLWIVPVSTRGTTFRLAIHAPRAAPEESRRVDPRATPALGIVRPLRVLVADDQPVNRTVASSMLRLLGHAVDTVDDGQAVLARLRNATYDLVLMDVEMPGLDGLAATRALRNQGIGVRVLGFTAHTSREHDARCLAAGMHAVVHKPVDLAELASAVNAATSDGPTPMEPVPTVLAVESILPPTPRPIGDRPLIDVADLLRRLGNQPSLLASVVRATLSESERLSQELHQHARARDLAAIVRVAHALRGAMANVGAAQVSADLLVAENAARDGDEEGAIEAAYQALSAYAFTRDALAVHAASLPK